MSSVVDSSFRRALAPAAAVLAVLAILNLAAGVWLSFSKGSFSDLLTVSGWIRTWLAGSNPYGPGSATDYPPWALVALAPIALVSVEWLPSIWVMVNIALALAIASMLAGASREPRPIRRHLLFLLAATACLRTFAQFSHLSYALAIRGALAASSWSAGLLTGLSLMKPQIGGAVILWSMVRGEWRRVAIALSVPVALTAVFCSRAGVSPVEVLAQYRGIIASIHSDPTVLPGHSDLRFWLWSLWPTAAGNLWLSMATTVVLVAPLLLAAARRQRPIAVEDDLELLALCGVISLLAVRHLSYDFILVLPALIAWRCPPLALRTHAPRVLFAVLAVLLIVALPSWIRLAVNRGAPPGFEALTEIDRAMCLALWCVLSWRVIRSAHVRAVRPSAVP